MLSEDRLLVDGKLTVATGSGTYENVDPATGAVLGVAADSQAADVDSAIAAARAALLGRMIAERTDIPPGVVNVITSARKDIGELITTDPRVDLVSFTGSTATGRRIMAACSDTVKRVFLELGGKSAFASGLASGTRPALGGRRPDDLPDGFFYEPTLLVDMPPDTPVTQEEIFGPVLVVIPYEDDDDAVRIANDSIYGLSGAVAGGDPARATAVARRLRTGTVGINGGQWYGADVPFGCYKQSGIGREMGVPGFEEYLETKSLAITV